MALFTDKTIVKTVIDFFMPHNCRLQLYAAAAKHKAVCDDACCLISDNKEKLQRELKNETRAA